MYKSIQIGSLLYVIDYIAGYWEVEVEEYGEVFAEGVIKGSTAMKTETIISKFWEKYGHRI